MGRPKGSKNKKSVIKDIPKANEVKEGTPPKSEPIKTVQSATTFNQMWTPSPDMGDIKPPPDKDFLCVDCGHKKEMHYGAAKEWCNTPNCRCLEWKS